MRFAKAHQSNNCLVLSNWKCTSCNDVTTNTNKINAKSNCMGNHINNNNIDSLELLKRCQLKHCTNIINDDCNTIASNDCRVGVHIFNGNICSRNESGKCASKWFTRNISSYNSLPKVSILFCVTILLLLLNIDVIDAEQPKCESKILDDTPPDPVN